MNIKALLEEMSFREKSAWVSTLVIGYVIFVYLRDMNNLSANDALTIVSMKKELIQAVFITVMLNILGHVVIGIIDKNQAEVDADERDSLIDLQANNLGYTTLAVAVFVSLFLLWFMGDTPELYQHRLLFEELPVSYNVFNVLVVGFLISELVRYSAQVYYYRRGF